MNYKDVNDYEMLYLVEDRNEDAYYYMYDKYVPLISKLSRYYYNKFKCIGVEYDDLYQEGMFGLSVAINEYKKTNTALFYTMAFICIKREMQRLIIKFNRYKNLFNSNSISLDQPIVDGNMTLENTIYNVSDIVDMKYINNVTEKSIVDTKYELDNIYALVYELKSNGFTNIEISKLLDIPYKKVDNSLRFIKNHLKKNNIE